MNFDFSEDQKLLKEQVSKFLADNCNIDVVRDVLEGESSYSEVVWNGLVELGLTGTAIPEEYGGIGLGALELCVIAEEIGRAAAPVPFSSSVYLGTDAIVKYGTESQKEKWLPKLASGEIISTFALPETNSEPTEKNIKTSILDGKINGKKIIFLGILYLTESLDTQDPRKRFIAKKCIQKNNKKLSVAKTV